MSYKDQEAQRGPGIDLKGGRWCPEYNEIIADMLGLHKRLHKLIEIALKVISEQQTESGPEDDQNRGG